MSLIEITEYGEGLDYECPVCSAEKNQPCCEDEGNGTGRELGLYIHKERYDLLCNEA